MDKISLFIIVLAIAKLIDRQKNKNRGGGQPEPQRTPRPKQPQK